MHEMAETLDNGAFEQLLKDAEMEERKADERAALNAPTSNPLLQLGLELEQLDSEIDSLDEQIKSKKARRDEIKKRDLPDAMRALGIVKPDGKGSFTLANGARVSLTTKLYASVKAGDRAALHTWLRETGNDSLIKAEVSGSTLSSHVRELLDDGRPVPSFITTYRETTATVARPKQSQTN